MEQQTPSYTSLEEIRLRKTVLQKQLGDSGKEVKTIWDSIFHKSEPSPSSPTQRLMSLASTSAGLIDGAILGWKLYRKFKK